MNTINIVNRILGVGTRPSAPRVSFKELTKRADYHRLRWDGRYVEITGKRTKTECEIQLCDKDGVLYKNYTEPFMVNIKELKQNNNL